MDFTNNMQVVEHVFGPLAGRDLADIGCGRGALLRALTRRGATATGIDPSDDLLKQARARAPEASVLRAGAQELPVADDAFDGAIFLNSLHHIPQGLIRAALAEAMRVVRPGGAVLVIEPLARGGYQQVFALIDDETEIRAGALAHLAAYRAEAGVETILDTEYDTDVKETGLEDILRYGQDIDPARAGRIETVRDEVARLFAHHARETEGGFLLDQPMIAVAMRKGTAC